MQLFLLSLSPPLQLNFFGKDEVFWPEMAKATVRPCQTPPLGTSVSMWNGSFRIEETDIFLTLYVSGTICSRWNGDCLFTTPPSASLTPPRHLLRSCTTGEAQVSLAPLCKGGWWRSHLGDCLPPKFTRMKTFDQRWSRQRFGLARPLPWAPLYLCGTVRSG